MDSDLLLAIGEHESGFDQYARGSSGEVGIFQIMPANVKKFSTPEEDPFDVAVNTRMASELLSEEMTRYNNDPYLSAAAYNAGSPAVDRAIEQAGSNDYEDIAPYLPELTRDVYVPSVMEKYNRRKNERMDQTIQNQSDDSTVEASDNSESVQNEWGTPNEFTTAMQDYITSPGFDDLSAQDQVQGVSRIYQSRKWLPQVDQSVRDVTKAIWDNSDVDERPDLREVVNPYLSLIEGEDAEAIDKSASAARKKIQRDLKGEGFNPNLVASLIDESFNKKINKEKSDVRGIFEEGIAAGKEVAKGALDLFTGAAAGGARLAGYEDAANKISAFGETTLGEDLSQYYELDKNGEILFDQNNEPVTKYRGNVLRGMGNVFAAVATAGTLGATAAAAGITGAGAIAVQSLGLGSINALNSMGQAYELANQTTGNRDDAMHAALSTLPTSAINTAADLYTFGAGKFWLQGLTGANKLRAVAQLATRSALLGAAGNAVEQTGIEYAAQSSTDGAYQASAGNIRSAAIGGAVAGAALGSLEGYGFRPKPAPRAPGEIKVDQPVEVGAAPPPPPPDGQGTKLIEGRQGPIPGLPLPDRYGSTEAVMMPLEATAEQQIAIAQKIESFAKSPESTLLLDYSDMSQIPDELLTLFSLDAQKLSDEQVALIKRETYTPPVVEGLQQIDATIDRLSTELASSPDSENQAKLVAERQAIKQELYKVTKSNRELEKNASQYAQEKTRLEREIKNKERQQRSFRDPVLRGVLDIELTDLRNQLAPLTELAAGSEGRAIELSQRLGVVNEQLREMQNPSLYENNRMAKQRFLKELLTKRSELTGEDVKVGPDGTESADGEPNVDQRFKEAAVRVRLDPDLISSTADTDFYILPVNDRWFALDADGTPVTSGHAVFKDALRALDQSQRPDNAVSVQAVTAGTSDRVPPLKLSMPFGKAIGASKETMALAAAGKRDIEKIAKPKGAKGKSKGRKKGPEIIGREGFGDDSENFNDSFGESVNNEAFRDDYSDSIQFSNPRDSAEDGEGVQGSGTEAEQSSGGNKRDRTSIGKVDVDPIENEGMDIKGARQLIKEAQQVFKRASKKGGMPKGVLGVYVPRFKTVKTAFRGDIGTTLHELAHSKDDQLGLGHIKNMIKGTPVDGQYTLSAQDALLFGEMYELGIGGSGGPDKSMQYNMAEGAAEYLRAWMVNPDHTAKMFPNTHEYMQRRIPEDLKVGLRALGDDIRTLVGAPAIKQVGAAIEYTPEQLGFVDSLKRFFGGTAVGDDFNLTGKDAIKKRFVNEMNAAIQASRHMQKRSGEKFLPENDIEMLIAGYSGINGKVEEAYRSGIPHPYDATKTMSKGIVESVYKHLDTTSMDTMEDELKLMFSRMVVDRAMEKELIRRSGVSQSLSEIGPITGIAGFANLESKGQTESMIIDKFNTEWSKLPEDQRKRIQKAAKGYRDYADAGLRYTVDRGLLSKDAYEQIKSQNAYYVALNRVMDSEGFDILNNTRGGSLNNRLNSIKTLRGSGAAIQNPMISLMINTARMIEDADRNYIMQQFTAPIMGSRQGMYDGKPAFGDIGEKMNTLPGPGDPSVTKVRRNGKLEYWKLHPDIKDAFDSYGSNPSNPIIEMAGKMNSLLQKGIVYSPPFVTRNWLRDTIDRFVQSEIGPAKQARATLNAAKNIMSPTLRAEATAEARRAGVDQMGNYMKGPVEYYSAMSKAMQEVANEPGSVLSIPTRAWEGWKDFASDSELIGRLAEYNAQKEHAKNELGYDEHNAQLYAMAKARGILDFAVVGTWMKTIRKLVPFSNAQMQYLRKTYDTATTRPGQLIARTMLFAVIPQLLTRQFNESQGAGDEYDQQPAYRRNLFFMMKSPTGWYYIPKPFPVVMASKLTDMAYDAAKGSKGADDSAVELLASQLSPIGPESLSTILKPTIEVIMNKDVFRDKTIVPPYEERLSLENRKEAKGTSRVADLIQKGAENAGLGNNFVGKRLLNARAVDHQLRGYFGTLGGLAVQAGDTTLKTLGVGKEEGGQPLTVKASVGLSGESAIYGSKDVEFVMDFAESEGVSIQNRKMKQLKDEMDTYFGTKDPAEKEKAAEKVYERAASIRKGIEARGRDYFGPRRSRKP